MIEIRRKDFLGMSLLECWNDVHGRFRQLFTLCQYNNVAPMAQANFLIKTPFTTLEIDLEQSVEEIFSQFSKPVRNAIRQAERNGVVCNYAVEVEEFLAFFNAFARAKGIPELDLRYLNEFDGKLFISTAIMDGVVCSAHCYILDFEMKYATLFRSASVRVLVDDISGNEIGKANKFLHFKDIQFLKQVGMRTYGFGGYSPLTKNDGKDGVNKFKSSFGGEVKYNLRCQTIPFFLARQIKNLLT